MSEFGKILRAVGKVADNLEAARERGETDPLRIVDAMLGGSYIREDQTNWWHLFGLEEKPTTRAVLDGAWKRWAGRNHPDAGGDKLAFGHMSDLHKRMRETIPA